MDGSGSNAGTGTSDLVNDFFEHHGVKGMHWGVRRSHPSSSGSSGGSSSGTKPVSSKKLEKAQKKFVKNAGKSSTFFKVYNSAAGRMNKTEIGRINSKPEYKNQSFSKDSPLRRKYYKEYEDTFKRVLNEESDRLLGQSPKGDLRVQFDPAADGDIHVRLAAIKHADMPYDFLAKTDAKGFIVSIRPANNSMSQSEDFDDFFEHFGVKGMHWGIRRNRSQGPSSSDARNAAQVRAKIGQNGGTHSLTNKELQDFITRANLEQQYSRLAHEDPKLVKGHNFIKSAIGLGQTANNVYNLYNSPLSKELRKLLKEKRG